MDSLKRRKAPGASGVPCDPNGDPSGLPGNPRGRKSSPSGVRMSEKRMSDGQMSDGQMSAGRTTDARTTACLSGTRTEKARRSCLQSCVAILAFADNTEKQLREKLEKRGYAEGEIAAAIAKVKEKGLYSERTYALQFLRSYAGRGYGPRRITAAMAQKGFSRENLMMAEALLRGESPSAGGPYSARDNSDIENLLSSLDFLTNCAILITKAAEGRGYPHFGDYLRSGELPEEKEDRAALFRERQKLRAALLRRGFAFSTVKEAEEEAGRLLALREDTEDG